MRHFACLVCVLVAALPAIGHATIFCAATPAAIAAALDTAEANGEADEVRIVAGTYLLPATLVHSTHEAFALKLSGRWNSGCTSRNGALSTLDGNGMRRILYVFSDATADLEITDLYFSRGHNSAGIAGGGLSIETSSRNVLVERNLFFGNSDTQSAGAARIAVSTSNSLVTIRNNVLLGNNAPEGAGLVVNAGIGTAHIIGNTVAANTAGIAGALCGGLCIAGGSDFIVSNNLLWNNGGGDLHIDTTGMVLLHSNDVGAMSGNPPDSVTGHLSIDPGFAPGLLNLRLAADSPLVNAGAADAAGGIGMLDADGTDRLQGAGVDIGAYETDVLFRDGVDLASSAP